MATEDAHWEPQVEIAAQRQPEVEAAIVSESLIRADPGARGS